MSKSNFAEALSVDQMRVLVAIVDTGSFSAAARALQRSQSAVSYQVGALEQQLELRLFRRTRRRPELTPDGRAIVASARTILAAFEDLRGRARALGAGLEAHVRLAVDVLYPTDKLASLLQSFEAEFPSVDIDLRIGVRAQPIRVLAEGDADVAVVPEAEGFEARLACQVELVAVASPEHPLAQRKTRASDAELAKHLRLLLVDARPGGDGEGARRWRLNDSLARRALLLAGVGWCMMPRHQVAADLDDGRLAEVKVRRHAGKGRRVPLYAAHRRGLALGPATRWWFEQL